MGGIDQRQQQQQQKQLVGGQSRRRAAPRASRLLLYFRARKGPRKPFLTRRITLVLLFSMLTSGAGSIKVFSAFNAFDRSSRDVCHCVVSSSWCGAVKTRVVIGLSC
jgi:hypothetical protein